MHTFRQKNDFLPILKITLGSFFKGGGSVPFCVFNHVMFIMLSFNSLHLKLLLLWLCFINSNSFIPRFLVHRYDREELCAVESEGGEPGKALGEGEE